MALPPPEGLLTRPHVPAMDALIAAGAHPVLDHGFVRVVDYMGGDDAVVQAARVSYGPGTKTTREDRSLIHYLTSHRHTTPFEQAEVKFHVKLPIFVARQWVRHRTANLNEVSARYTVLPAEFYVPSTALIRGQGRGNKQGSGAPLPELHALSCQTRIRASGMVQHTLYRNLMMDHDDIPGMSRETARTVLPLSTYTEFYWKIDLHNLLHFLGLRFDEHAQAEISAYAEVMLGMVRKWVPLTVAAWEEHVRNAVRVPASVADDVRAVLAGKTVDPERWAAVHKLFGVPEPVPQPGLEDRSGKADV